MSGRVALLSTRQVVRDDELDRALARTSLEYPPRPLPAVHLLADTGSRVAVASIAPSAMRICRVAHSIKHTASVLLER